jgi:hypothetical protein
MKCFGQTVQEIKEQAWVFIVQCCNNPGVLFWRFVAWRKGTISDPTHVLNLRVEWFFHSNQTFFILFILSYTSDNRLFFRKRKRFIHTFLYLFTLMNVENTYLLCASIRLSPIPFTNRDNLHEKSVSSFWNHEQKHKLWLYNTTVSTTPSAMTMLYERDEGK